jgi:predicted nucleic acid-binding protein
MNGIDFCVDTNVLIYILGGHPAVSHISQYSFSLGVSVISEIELLGRKNIPQHDINVIQSLLNDCEIINFNNTIKDIAISLKQKYSIKTPDAIVAATAKWLNLSLITADRDFKRIEDVDIVLLDLYSY